MIQHQSPNFLYLSINSFPNSVSLWHLRIEILHFPVQIRHGFLQLLLVCAITQIFLGKHDDQTVGVTDLSEIEQISFVLSQGFEEFVVKDVLSEEIAEHKEGEEQQEKDLLLGFGNIAKTNLRHLLLQTLLLFLAFLEVAQQRELICLFDMLFAHLLNGVRPCFVLLGHFLKMLIQKSLTLSLNLSYIGQWQCSIDAQQFFIGVVELDDDGEDNQKNQNNTNHSQTKHYFSRLDICFESIVEISTNRLYFIVS